MTHPHPMTMTLSRQIILGFALAWVVICAGATASAQSPETPDGSKPEALGDVARQKKEQSVHAKKAKRVLRDEDVPSSHTHRMSGTAASMKIIPDIIVTGLVPDGVSARPEPSTRQKMYAWFGPTAVESCGDLECAEETYLQTLPSTFGGTGRIRFDSDEEIQGYTALVAHIEIAHDTRGKMLGIVALIQTSVGPLAASCAYRVVDAPEVEADCEAFIESLEIKFPERYIYVNHNP
jgi:hypothetical protein